MKLNMMLCMKTSLAMATVVIVNDGELTPQVIHIFHCNKELLLIIVTYQEQD